MKATILRQRWRVASHAQATFNLCNARQPVPTREVFKFSYSFKLPWVTVTIQFEFSNFKLFLIFLKQHGCLINFNWNFQILNFFFSS